MRRYLLLFFITIISVHASAQSYLLTGKITDSGNKPVAFASVYIKNSTYGTVTNEEGKYQLKLTTGSYEVVNHCEGYKQIIEKIIVTDHNVQHNVQLVDENYQLQQFNGANGEVQETGDDIVRKIISKGLFYQKQVKQYSCVVYIKGVQKLVFGPRSLIGQNVDNALSVDSTGKGILYQSESLSDYSFKQPGKIKEEMVARRSAGQNTAFSYNRASDLSANFYQNILTIPGLSSHGFISPLASNALHYYHYNLIGAKIENGVKIDKIQVIPKRRFDPVFSGNIYVVDGDWQLYGVDLMLTNKDNGLNQVDTLTINQEYVPVTDSVWMPLMSRYSFKGSILGLKFEGCYLSVFNNYNINPAFQDQYFDGERMRIDTLENSRDSGYWQKVRPVPLTKQEQTDYTKKEFRAEVERSIAKYDPDRAPKNRFHPLPYLLYGYKASYNNDKDSLFVDPFIQTFFYNTVEGLGINLRSTYAHYYNDLRSYSITPNIRYGYADKQFNANVRGEYVYDPLNRGKFTAGFGSDLLDLSNVGTRSLYFNTLSTLLSEQNFVKYYRSEFAEFGYQHNLNNSILWQANLSYANRTQLYNNSYYSISTYTGRNLTSNNPLKPDAPATDRSVLFPQNRALTFSTSFTFTFNQQYVTRSTGRSYEESPYPQIRVNYRKGINGLFDSAVDYDFTSIELFQEHLTTGITGFSAFKFVAGDFLNRKRLYFMDYNHFLGNEGTTFDAIPGSFHFLPFYTYSTDGPFFEAHYEHNFTGYLFNNVPLLRKLKLDEIIGVNYLTEKNNHNYSEFYAGVQRLIFRVDYGVAFAGNHKYLQGFRIFYGIK